MEKIPSFRVVGDVPKSVKEEASDYKRKFLHDHFESLLPSEKERLKKLEYPKSEKEIALINFANEETSRLMQEAGVESYNVPIDNFHILPSDFYQEIKGKDTNSDASTSFVNQGIIFDAKYMRNNPVHFGSISLHELLHLKGHMSIEVEETSDGKHSTTQYREGVTVKPAQKLGFHGMFHTHFSGLHEAIVSTQQKKSYPKMLELPILAEEKKRIFSEDIIKLKEKIANKREISPDEIIWVGDENEVETFSYRAQRRVLEYVCQEIQKEFPSEFSSEDEVFKVFLGAQFTGRLLPIAKFVEKTFGQGGFRLLSNMDTTRDSANVHLEALRKKRLQITKEK